MSRYLSFTIQLLICVFAYPLISQTIIPDKTEIAGNWTTAGSPYIIQGEAIVPRGQALLIDAGVEVRLKTGQVSEYKSPLFDLGMIHVQGSLRVSGSAGQPVLFSRDGDQGNWGIIFFDETADSCSLDFTIIENASKVAHLINWMEHEGALSINAVPVDVENCIIRKNAFDGIFINEASPRVKGTLISGNGANGIRNIKDGRAVIINSTIADNGAHGVDFGLNSEMSLINSIVWNNGSGLTFNKIAFPSLSHNLLQDESLPENFTDAGGNLMAIDPQFLDMENGNYHLAGNSVAINAGQNELDSLSLPATDLDGKTRILYDNVDMGAFEFEGTYLRLVRPNGFESWKPGRSETVSWYTNASFVDIDFSPDSGLTWQSVARGLVGGSSYDWQIPETQSEQCFLQITDAADAQIRDRNDQYFIIDEKTIIPDGMKVSGLWQKMDSPFVLRGEALVPPDTSLRIEAGVRVLLRTGNNHQYGSAGFNAGLLRVQGRLEARGTMADSIIFSGQDTTASWGTILFSDGAAEGSVIEFARIENGSFIDSLPDGGSVSGAVSAIGVSPQISNCAIAGNARDGIFLMGAAQAIIDGNSIRANGRDGLHFSNGSGFVSPEITNNVFRANGRNGLFLAGSVNPKIQYNIISHHDSSGIHLETGYATPYIENNQLTHNYYGLRSEYSEPSVVNNLLARNHGGLLCRGGDAQISGNTIADNSSFGIYCEDTSPIISNTIFAGNGSDFNFSESGTSAPYVSYSLFDKSFFSGKIQDMGYNRLAANPGFKKSGTHPYSIGSSSQGIDHGVSDNITVPVPEFDLAGKIRILDGDEDGTAELDIGAYEYAEIRADFIATPTDGQAPLDVQFSDRSKGDIASRLWLFGDGDSSDAKNPKHTYLSSGSFDVTLIVRGPAGTDTTTKIELITIKNPPFVKSSIADTAWPEDSPERLVALLDTVFADEDSSEVLRYSARIYNKSMHVRLQKDSLFVGSDADYFGKGRVIVTAKNQSWLWVNDTFYVTIQSRNDPPQILDSFPDSVSFRADSSLQLDIWPCVQDVESADSALSYSFKLNNDSLRWSFADSSGQLTLFCDPLFSGTGRLYFQVSDDSAAAVSDSFKINVWPVTAIKAEGTGALPRRFALHHNYPNPFNPQTTIRYDLPQQSDVQFMVFNVLGQKVWVGRMVQQSAGYHRIIIDAQRLGLSSGIYFYHLQAGSFRATRKMVLMR